MTSISGDILIYADFSYPELDSLLYCLKTKNSSCRYCVTATVCELYKLWVDVSNWTDQNEYRAQTHRQPAVSFELLADFTDLIT